MENPFPAENPTLQILESIVGGEAIDIHTGSMGVGYRTGRTIEVGAGEKEFLIDGRPFILHHEDDDVRPYYNFSLRARCKTVTDEILQLSSFLADQFITNGNTVEHQVDDDQPTPLIIHVDQTNCHGVAILKFDANELFNASSILSIELQTTLITQINLIVINVLGKNPILPANIKFNNNQWMSDFANARTIWNFYQAETLELRNVFIGAILAPLAAVQTNATIIGSIAAQSLMTTCDIQLPTVVMPSCI